MRLVDYESYWSPAGQRYAGIWEKHPDYLWAVKTNLSQTDFFNLRHGFGDDGYRLVDFECNTVNGQLRYAGIWAEASSRARSPKKKHWTTSLQPKRKPTKRFPASPLR